jgi:hypothetical protein
VTIDAADARFDIGRAIGRALALLKRDPLKLLLWSVAFAGLPDAAMTYANARFSGPEAAFSSPTSWILLAATLLTSMLGLVALQAVIARLAHDHDGPHAHSGETAFGGLNDYLALVVLGLVTSLGIIAGFILLIIPGIVLSLAWLVVVPAMVTERLGVMDSIRRSNALTGNARGQILGLSDAVGLAGWLAAWLVGLIVDAVSLPMVALITSPALQVVIGLVNSALAVAVYQELRWNKEGASADRLVEVFA